jgi:predicted PurR-regulated permease PerM
MENHSIKSNEKKVRRKKSIIFRIIFIIIYSIVLYYLYTLFLDLGVEQIIILLILIFLILIVIGPLLTGISKDIYSKLFQSVDKKSKQKSDYQIYKEGLKNERPISQDKQTNNISLDFKYKKSIIRKCLYCGMIIPNFVKKCPYCGKPILY